MMFGASEGGKMPSRWHVRFDIRRNPELVVPQILTVFSLFAAIWGVGQLLDAPVVAFLVGTIAYYAVVLSRPTVASLDERRLIISTLFKRISITKAEVIALKADVRLSWFSHGQPVEMKLRVPVRSLSIERNSGRPIVLYARDTPLEMEQQIRAWAESASAPPV